MAGIGDNVVAVDGEGAAIRFRQGRDHPEEGRFARPVRADDTEGFTALEIEGNVFDGGQGIERLPDVFCGEHGG